jgi:hypothetical protein
MEAEWFYSTGEVIGKGEAMNREYPAFDISDAELCGDALTRGAENLLVQAARAVNAVPDDEDEQEKGR